MNIPQSTGLSLKAGLLGLLLVVCLGSEYWHRASLPWPFLNQAQAEVFATFQAADVQWLVGICLSIYFVGFIWMLRSLNPVGLSWRDEAQPGTAPVAQACPPAGSGRVSRPGSGPPGADAPPTRSRGRLRNACAAVSEWARLDVPLVVGLALYGIVALAYALRYDQASRTTDALLFFFGITLFFGLRLWRAVEARRTQPFNLAGAVVGFTLVLLSIAAVWNHESAQNFQYRGQARWGGLWANPNTFGMLMGVGVVLAIGQAVLSLKPIRLRNASARQEGQSRSTAECGMRSAEWWRWVKMVLFLTAAGLCGLGLVKSYSRGAWLGAAIGLVYLTWYWLHGATHLIRPLATFSPSNAEKGARCGERESLSCGSCVSWLQKNWPPISVILISVLVLAFWNFRHTERLVARRAFSVGNVNDFSWRNRVAAYQGSLQMMAEKPWLGFGWNQPQRVYDEFYRPAKVDEGAAIQMNDYLTLGTTLGAPALLCFVTFIGLTLGRVSRVDGRAPFEPQPSAFSLQPSGFYLPSVCRGGALVLAIVFWFDGGLFKLATGATFWILLALGNEDHE